MKNFARLVGGSLLTLAFIFGITAVSGSTADAQYRNRQYDRGDRDQDRDQDRDRDGDRDNWRRHRDRDRDRNQNRRYDRNRTYGQYGNNGNYGRYGNNGRYGTYGGYGGYGGYSQADLNRGYQQGIETGSSDARHGQSYSPERSRHYRNASSQAYLEGFVRGYDQGYRQYAGNGRYRTGGYGGILGGILGRRY